MERSPVIRFVTASLATLGLALLGCSEAREGPLEVEATALRAHGATTASEPALLVSDLEGASGSTIGPDGALYVTEGAAGRISRVDPETGETTAFASGLPTAVIPIGGAMDVVFLDGTAYVLVTLVGFPFGPHTDGIYRVDGPSSFTVIADIGGYSASHPPATPFDLPNGLQYALQTFRGGFLVTDGHHNRVLRVTKDGEIGTLRAFDNIVPTGLEVHGNTIYMAEAGPVPHVPEDGKVVAFGPKSTSVQEVASGAPLLVDVEGGLGRTLFALSQGDYPPGVPPAGSPALPNTGSLVRITSDGDFSVVADGLNLPTSLELMGTTAYVVTLTGEIWTIDNVAGAPFGG